MTKPHKRLSPLLGNYTLADLLGKCRIDDETGCAVYVGKSPAIWLPPGVAGNAERVQINAGRAAWLLAGKTINPGHRVFRASCSCSAGCILPEHARAGTRKDHGKVVAAADIWKGNAKRAAANTRASGAHCTPVEVVRKIIDQLDAGASTRQAAKACGVSQAVACRVSQGKHSQDPRRLRCVANASIFTMARAA